MFKDLKIRYRKSDFPFPLLGGISEGMNLMSNALEVGGGGRGSQISFLDSWLLLLLDCVMIPRMAAL